MSWWLITIACVLALLLFGISVYVVLLYQSEEDVGQAWFPKMIVVLGLTLAMITVLLLPYDIANKRDPTTMEDFGKAVDTELLWQIILWAVVIMVIIIIPFTIFFYEAYDPDHFNFLQQVTPAVMYTFAIFLCFSALTITLWLTVGVARIPFYSYQGIAQGRLCWDPAMVYFATKTVEHLDMQVSLFVYTIAMVAAVGWVLFFVYGGVGISAFPIDVMADFMSRPKPITQHEFTRETEIIAAKAATLLQIGNELMLKQRRKNNTSVRNKINLFRNEVYMLEKYFDRTVIAFKEQGGSPFVVFGMLLLGVFGALLSMLWIMHIFIYNTLNASPFLNDMLRNLDKTFSLLGVIVYAIFSFYLLMCTVKGCIKVGMRIIFFQIHPMKVHDTMMNSMLFNAGLVLLCSVSVTQFCATSFRDYASNTAVDTLVNVYVKRLQGIGTVIAYMQFFFVAMAILAIFWLILCPRAEQKEKKDDSDDDVIV